MKVHLHCKNVCNIKKKSRANIWFKKKLKNQQSLDKIVKSNRFTKFDWIPICHDILQQFWSAYTNSARHLFIFILPVFSWCLYYLKAFPAQKADTKPIFTISIFFPLHFGILSSLSIVKSGIIIFSIFCVFNLPTKKFTDYNHSLDFVVISRYF